MKNTGERVALHGVHTECVFCGVWTRLTAADNQNLFQYASVGYAHSQNCEKRLLASSCLAAWWRWITRLTLDLLIQDFLSRTFKFD